MPDDVDANPPPASPPAPTPGTGPVNDFGAGLFDGDPTCCHLADTLADGVYVLDAGGRFRFVNGVIAGRFGLSRERAAELTYLDVVVPPDHKRVRGYVAEALAGRRVPPYTVDYATVEDRILTVEVSTQPIFRNGDVIGLLGISHDVTPRRQAEREQRRTARQLELILSGVAEHVIFHDPSMHIVWASRAAAESVGLEPEQMPGRCCYELWHGRDVPCEGCPVLDALHTGEPQHSEIATPDGRVWDVRGYPVQDDDGLLLGVVEMTLDVTERKRSEEALRASEVQYRALFSGSADGVSVVHDGRLVAVNQAACDICGRSRDAIIGLQPADLVVEEDRATLRERLEAVLRGERLEMPFTYRSSRPDGSIRLVELHSSPITWDGRPAVQSVLRDVTERRAAEEALRVSEEQYRTLFDRSADGVAVLLDGRLVAANQALCDIMGMPADEVIGRNPHDLLVEEDKPPARERMAQLVHGNRVDASAMFRLRRPDGSLRRVAVRSTPVRWQGRPAIQSILHDVTERVAAEEALRENESRYRAVVEAQTELVNRFLPDGTITFCNDALCRYLGKTRDEMIGWSYFPMLPDEDRKRLRAALASTTPESPIAEIEHTITLPSGESRWMHWTNRGIFDGDGRVTEYQAVGRDVTQRRQAEEALRQSEVTYREIFNAVHDMLFVHDVESGDVVDMNQRAVEAYGFGLDELDALNAFFRNRTDEPYAFADQMQWLRRAADEGPQLFEWQATDRHGRPFWVEVGVRRARIAGTERLLAVLRDVAERKAAEEALRRSKEDYHRLFAQNIDGIAVHVGRTIVQANRAFADILGVPADSLLGRDGMDFMHPDECDTAAIRMARRMNGEPQPTVPSRYRLLRPDGTPRLVELVSQAVEWKGMEALQTIVRDVSEQVQLEEQLRQAMKMEAVGQLAGGIAHDFNNLMTGILCHAGLLRSEPSVTETIRETAGLIEGAARRAAELTSQLLGFARRGKQQDVPVDLVATVETSINLLSRSLDTAVAVRSEFQQPEAYVRGDPVQVEQVILNLAMNARDAMPDGGTLTLAVEPCEIGDEPSDGGRRGRSGRFVVLAVTDTGVGIPKDQQSRVFEPFFTTKPLGKGTGMGLAMVYGIVRNHGGWIDVESEPGQGTTFRVYLPAAEAPAAAGDTAADTPEAPPGRILVVDDERLVRDVLSRMLRRLGYDVDAVASGDEAIAYVRERPARVALAIIDFRMPGMDGRQCFRALRHVDPNLRVILATGGGGRDSLQDLLDEGLVAVIQKPFEIDGLDHAVRQTLAR